MKTEKKKQRIIITAVAIVFFVIIAVLLIKPVIATISDTEQFRAWAQEKGVWGVLAFTGLCALQVMFAVIPAGPFELAGGYAFGSLFGSALVLLGNTIGSMFVFTMVKKFGRKFSAYLISEEKLASVKFLRSEKKLTLLTLGVYLIPGSPKDVITYAAGFTKINYLEWLVINLIGRIPGIALTVITGSALGNRQYTGLIILWSIMIPLYVAGFFLYRKISRTEEEEEKAEKIPKSPAVEEENPDGTEEQ